MAMLTFDSIPQARVVRKGGHEFAPPPAPRTRETPVLREHARAMLAVAVGLWPLTGVVLLALGLLFMVGMSGAP
jgi:hypothetical protein